MRSFMIMKLLLCFEAMFSTNLACEELCLRMTALTTTSSTSRIRNIVSGGGVPVMFLPSRTFSRAENILIPGWSSGVHLVPNIWFESLQSLLMVTVTAAVLTASRRSSHWEESRVDDGRR